MSSPQQVANSFVVEFFERLATNPAELAELYGHNASLTINDFEMGTTEAHDEEVAPMMEKWAMIVQGSQLRVESVNAAALYSGVNVFITLTAVGELQQYFQITTTLESWANGFATEGYYIRHQVISRIGALPAEQAATPTELDEQPAPIAEPAVAAAAEPKPTPAPEQPVPEAKEAEEEEKHATPAATEETPAAKERAATPEEAAPAVEPPQPPAAKPAVKSWASLASLAPTKRADAPKVVRVVARDGQAAKKDEKHEETNHNGAGPAAGHHPRGPAANPAASGPREHARRERRAPEQPLGDRLMFAAEVAVTDEEIRSALGPLAASLVSLRNNSERGHVFMDFAANAKAFDTLHKNPPSVGTSGKVKMTVFRQRNREEK